MSLKAARTANLFRKTRPLSALMAKLREHPRILKQSITDPDGFVPPVISKKGHFLSKICQYVMGGGVPLFGLDFFWAVISPDPPAVRLILVSSTVNLSVQ